jgi:hypothetical protein
MATLIQRIDHTRSHLTKESLALVTRTRRAVTDEATDWQTYFLAQRDAVRAEVGRLTAPRGLERAALRLADGALSRAHGTVQARLGVIERELSRAARATKSKTKKARPAAKRPRPSRKLVTEPTAA